MILSGEGESPETAANEGLTSLPEEALLTNSPLDNLISPPALPTNKNPGKNRGHLSVADYTGCPQVSIEHEILQVHGLCPACAAQEVVGKLYPTEPGVFVCLQGQPLIGGTRYTVEKLRCNTCQKIYSAPLPAELVNQPKYDAGCRSNIALSRYYLGLPFKRVELWQQIQGVPLKDATQWDLMKQLWSVVQPVCLELESQAAEGQNDYFDDTTARILYPAQPQVTGLPARKGIYTTAIVSEFEGHRIYLFRTSQCYGAENMKTVLEQRQSEESFAVMSDASPLNTLAIDAALQARMVICFCLVHGRRNFFELLGHRDPECEFVIDIIGRVYGHEKVCKKQGFSPGRRLAYHQAHSLPLMNALRDWLNNQWLFKRVEPNSDLGKAMSYMLRHWDRLTQFLRHAGVPMDNSLCEQAIKVVIRHRRNSLFYRTPRGAKVGDDLMGLIHTAVHAGANVFDYLNALQEHASQVSQSPGDWLPWTYRSTLYSLGLAKAA